MPGESTSRSPRREQASGLGDLPRDELLRYGLGLGLALQADAPVEDIIGRIRERQEMLIELDRDALLDVVVWARRPVRRSAGKEELAREIARTKRTNYRGLSRRGLVALARLRDIPAGESDDVDKLIDRIRKQDGLWKRLTGKRRSLAGSLITKLLDSSETGETTDYRFLPEEATDDKPPAAGSLKTQIEDHGIVGGLASRLRGAADDYVRVKLDEIEVRIDTKLDEIDKRLSEWRDREVLNRLRILRITLLATVLVALLSLGYNLIKTGIAPGVAPKSEPTSGPGAELSGASESHPADRASADRDLKRTYV